MELGVGRWRLAGQQRQNIDVGANESNSAGDSASGTGNENWGGTRERLGLARRAFLGSGGRGDVGGVQKRKSANGCSGSRDILERGAMRISCKHRADA